MEASVHFDDRDARLKAGRSLVKMKVKNERVLNLGLGENNRIDLGEYEIMVWEREVPTILAMVETDHAAIEMAKQALETAIARQALDFVNDSQIKSLADDQLLDLIREGKTTALNEAVEKARKTTGHSVQGEFRRLRGRDIRPLSEAKRIGDNEVHPSPYQLNEVAHAKMVAGIMNGSGASKK
jgi:hypothetical protein